MPIHNNHTILYLGLYCKWVCSIVLALGLLHCVVAHIWRALCECENNCVYMPMCMCNMSVRLLSICNYIIQNIFYCLKFILSRYFKPSKSHSLPAISSTPMANFRFICKSMHPRRCIPLDVELSPTVDIHVLDVGYFEFLVGALNILCKDKSQMVEFCSPSALCLCRNKIYWHSSSGEHFLVSIYSGFLLVVNTYVDLRKISILRCKENDVFLYFHIFIFQVIFQ